MLQIHKILILLLIKIYYLFVVMEDKDIDLILEYDNMGFIPKKGENVSNYMHNSCIKKEILADPISYFKNKYGVYESKLYELPTYCKRNFEEESLTKPWPAILISKEEEKKILKEYVKSIINRSYKQKISFYLFCLIFPSLFIADKTASLGCGGRTIQLYENPELNIPLIVENENSSYTIDEKYFHEFQHAISSQFTNKLREEYSFKFQKLCENSNDNSSAWTHGLDYGIMYSLFFGPNTPLLASYFFLTPYSLLLAGIPIPITTYNFWRTEKKIDKFIEKCEKEKLPPWYLLLRTNLKEFNSSKTIKEQINEKSSKELKYEIIKKRLQDELYSF